MLEPDAVTDLGLQATPPAPAAAAVAKGVHDPPGSGLDADGDSSEDSSGAGAGPAVDTAADTAATPGPSHGDDGIYYHRELAVRSLDGTFRPPWRFVI